LDIKTVMEEAEKAFCAPTRDTMDVPKYTQGPGWISMGEWNGAVRIELSPYDGIDQTKREIRALARPIIEFFVKRGLYLQSVLIEDAYGDVEYPDDHTSAHLRFADKKIDKVIMTTDSWTGRSYNDEKEIKKTTEPW
jgi:hypothetical protein